MRAVALVAPRKLELCTIPDAEPGPRDVLVRPEAVGVCGTDFHVFAGDTNYHLDDQGKPVPLEVAPQVLGHEITGVIEAVGRDVADLRRGDRVIVDQGLNCHSFEVDPLCEYCETGHSHQCEHYQEYGITGLQGGFAEALAVPAINAVALREPLDPQLAAIAEPIGCVLHSTEMATRAAARYAIGAAEPSRRVRSALVCGAGPSGLLFVQVLRRILGFDGPLFVSEPNPARRALAESLGAEGIDPSTQDLAATLLERTDGRGVEYLVEASGCGVIFHEIPRLLRKHGTIVLYSTGHVGTGLEVLNPVQWCEPTFVMSVGASGGFDEDGRPSIYRRALRLLEEGVIDAASLLTHRYDGLDAVPDAFAGDHRQPDYVKGVTLL